MSNPDIQAHELTDTRRAADKMPFAQQVKLHALLDAYESLEEIATKLDEVEGNVTKLEDAAQAAIKTLREVLPKKREEHEDVVSEETWQEMLAEFDPPEDPEDGQPKHKLAELKAKRDVMIANELERARVAEVKLRARVEALEDAIESAVEQLE